MRRPDFTRGFIPEQTQQERLKAPLTCEQLPGTHFLLPEVRLLQSTLWGRFPCLLQLTAAPVTPSLPGHSSLGPGSGRAGVADRSLEVWQVSFPLKDTGPQPASSSPCPHAVCFRATSPLSLLNPD